MDLIEQLQAQGFSEYLKKYGNTICGRHPIAVLLNVSGYLTDLIRELCVIHHLYKYKYHNVFEDYHVSIFLQVVLQLILFFLGCGNTCSV